MTHKNLILYIALIVTLCSLRSESDKRFNLGNNSCKITSIGDNEKYAKFISLHDNENTSVEAFLEIKNTLSNCKLYELKQNGERLLKYKINGKNYSFDPNRIFSKIGIKGTISKYNAMAPKELENGLILFADSLLQSVGLKNTKCYIVAIHNNSNNDFSILSYKNSKDADEVYVNSMEDIDNFFIVVNKTDFDYFKSKKRNVVLQSIDAMDDGSLSVYCQKNKLQYINIEAQLGEKEEQIKMMKETYQLIKNKKQ